MNIKLSEQRCEEIKNIIVNLFVKFNINCVPISGFEICKKLGIEIFPYPNDDRKMKCVKISEDGFSVFRNNKWSIFYNSDKQYGRVNNTILHEIGHIVLDHTEYSEIAEKEAKFFAKYALVPPVLVHKLKLNTPEDISETFDVSYEAATYALSYYKKWLTFGGREYKSYEIKILKLFNI